MRSEAAAKAPGADRPPTLPRVSEDLLETARVAVVVDTNIFIDDLPLLRELSRIAYPEQLVIVIPSAVVRELDGLKNSCRVPDSLDNSSVSLSYLARAASKFISDDLGRRGSALRCQKIQEFLREEAVNDDKIVDCCLYIIQHRGLPVVMLTRDRILSIKARANGCATCDDWSHGPGGLLTAILTSGGLQAQAPIDDAPIAGTSQCDAEQSPSALSPNPYEAPKRRLWADKRAGRVSVKDAHRLKDSSPQHKSVVSNGRHTLRGAERPPKRGEKRDETQDSRTSKGKAAALELPTRVPLPTVPRLTLANGSFFGRDSGDFTFSMPADSFNNAVILGLRAEPTSGIDAENDDMDIDMDVDMSGNPEDHLTNAYPEAQRRQTSEFAAQPTLASQALSKPPATPHPPDLNAPTDGQQQQREIIYLDESPERNRLLGQAHSTSMSAIDMSRSVASFMHTPWSCGLTDLLEEQLAKYLSSSWHEDSRMAFAPPKWGSATVMLTLVLFHWHGVFSEVFSRSLPALIRESLPWVMWVEGLAECPQTTRPLPLSLRFKPFTYSSRASTTNSADSALDEEGIQEAERRAETRKLIHLARNMLAQCHLIESDERQRYRKKVVEGWVAWCDTHS